MDFTKILSILTLLASMAAFVEIIMERLKTLFPFINYSFDFKIGKQEMSIKLMQFITLAVSIGFFFAIGAQDLSLFTAIGYPLGEGLEWIDKVVNGILVSGGSNFIYDIIRKIKEKTEPTDKMIG